MLFVVVVYLNIVYYISVFSNIYVQTHRYLCMFMHVLFTGNAHYIHCMLLIDIIYQNYNNMNTI